MANGDGVSVFTGKEVSPFEARAFCDEKRFRFRIFGCEFLLSLNKRNQKSIQGLCP